MAPALTRALLPHLLPPAVCDYAALRKVALPGTFCLNRHCRGTFKNARDK